MQSLIIDILAFSRISIDKSNFVSSDLNEILKEIIIDVDDEIKSKKATIMLDHLPILNVNPRLMRMLFCNLISNALKYCRKDISPEIKVGVENGVAVHNRERKYCRIFVEDNGIGFDQRYAEDIFGMFKRLHHESEFSGTGIGLALCKKIVEQHNGVISAQSKVDKGSKFIVALPMP